MAINIFVTRSLDRGCLLAPKVLFLWGARALGVWSVSKGSFVPPTFRTGFFKAPVEKVSFCNATLSPTHLLLQLIV